MVLLAIAIIVCFISGIFSGLLGIGGGLILVPVFHYLLKMNFHLAVGTSLALIVPTALVGAIRHSASSYVDWKLIAFSVAFAVLGGYIGASLSLHIDVTLLRRVFAIFMILAALKMLLQ